MPISSKSLRLILLVILPTLILCKGKLYIKFLKYTHNGLASNGKKCESFGFGSFGDKCDPYFKIKIYKHGKVHPLYYWQSTEYNNLEGVHKFDHRVGKSPNPMTASFPEGIKKKELRLLVQIFDYDPNTNDDLIATINSGWQIVDFSSNGREPSYKKTFKKTNLYVTLEYQIWVSCDKHYYGDCSQHCQPLDSPTLGHYSCNRDTGARVCLSGWKGDSCLTPDLCYKNPCRNQGVCTQVSNHHSYCICKPGFSGIQCEKINHPCDTSPCQNGGICQLTGNMPTMSSVADTEVHPIVPIPDTKCFCQPGWTGRFCEEDVNECETVANLCGNSIILNSTCENLMGSFKCHCPPTRTGRHCHQPLVDRPQAFQIRQDAEDKLPSTTDNKSWFSSYGWLLAVALVSILIAAVVVLLSLRRNGHHQKFFAIFGKRSGANIRRTDDPLPTTAENSRIFRPAISSSDIVFRPKDDNRAASPVESLYEQVEENVYSMATPEDEDRDDPSAATRSFGNQVYNMVPAETVVIATEVNPLYPEHTDLQTTN